MQKLALLPIGLAAAALLAFFLVSRFPSDGSLDRASRDVIDAHDGEGAADEMAAVDDLALSWPAAGASTGSDRSVIATELAESPVRTRRIRGSVSGIVVDENERPMRDVLVQLAAYTSWSAAGEATPVTRYGDFPGAPHVGFEARTNEDGAFRLDFPPPSAERTWITVVPDRYHEIHRLWWTNERSGDGPRLGASPRDLGTIQLARAGTVFGRIVDEDGAPLADVEVDAGTEHGRHHRVRTKSGPDGRYVVAHAPVTTRGILAERDGYLSAFQEPVVVVAGQDAGPVDVAMGRAMTIRGIVVGAAGRPIEGARITGRTPPTSGLFSLVVTASDGSFTFHLPGNEPATLQATHPDFFKWGNDQDETTTFEPGLSDLRIVMDRAKKTRFVVVDRRTREPIERFGLQVLPRFDRRNPRLPPAAFMRPDVKAHPDGEVEVAAEPGLDRFVVRADGYPTSEHVVRHDEEGTPVQTVRARRGSTVAGRAIRNGEPVAGIDVSMVQGRIVNSSGPQPRFTPERGTRVTGVTDATGRFALTGLPRKRHRLFLRPGEGPPVIVDIERAPWSGKTLDLGDVDLDRGGTIDGVVLLPEGEDLEGISIRLDQWSDGPTAVTDGDGRFAFEGVFAGEHELLVLGKRSGIGRGSAGTVTVEDRATIPVELDLTSHLTIDVELTIELGGRPTEGLRVQLVALEPPGARTDQDGGAVVVPAMRFGETDESGTTRGEARLVGTCRVEVYSTDLGVLAHPTARIDLAPGRPVKDTVRFEVGSLALDLSDALPFPDHGKLHLRLSETAPTGRVARRTLPIVDGAVDPTSHAFARFDGDLLVLTDLPAGPMEWTLSATSRDTTIVWTDRPDGSRTGRAEHAFEYAGTVTVEIDWRTTLTVP